MQMENFTRYSRWSPSLHPRPGLLLALCVAASLVAGCWKLDHPDDPYRCADGCPAGQRCFNGACVATAGDVGVSDLSPDTQTCTANAQCDDSLTCTDDLCNTSTGTCSNNIKKGHCLINDACVAAGAKKTDAPCLVCLPGTDNAAWSTRSGACDDSDGCTRDDTRPARLTSRSTRRSASWKSGLGSLARRLNATATRGSDGTSKSPRMKPSTVERRRSSGQSSMSSSEREYTFWGRARGVGFKRWSSMGSNGIMLCWIGATPGRLWACPKQRCALYCYLPA